jgi:maltose/moltooligosaccharide transporter
MSKKPILSLSQIINMNVGFFGIQYSFGLQQSAVNPIYDFLGAAPDQIPLLNLAGPMTGLFIQPIIGALSDKTYSPRWGRRKPYFLIGAILCSICLFFFPFSSSLWMAVGLLWILDVGNNTAMEPYRAFVADRLDENQQGMGFQTQSFFTGFGQTLANLSLFIFPLIIAGKTGRIPNWVFASFFLGAVCSIGSIWWSIKTTPELPLDEEEIKALKSKPLNVLSPFIDVYEAIFKMPKVMWMLAVVYLFQWYALFCYWQNSSKSVALNTFGWTIPNEKEETLKKDYIDFEDALKKYSLANNMDFDAIKKGVSYTTLYEKYGSLVKNKLANSAETQRQLTSMEANDKKYEEAVSWTGLVNAWYNVVTFLVAFLLVDFAKDFSAKYVHVGCLILASLGLLFFPHIANKWLLFVAITGFGIGWASMMGIPYLMVVRSIPKEKYGVYMGIINMMIVIPMLIQTVTFGPIMKNLLANDSRSAILFAGVFLAIAAALTYFLIPKENEQNA